MANPNNDSEFRLSSQLFGHSQDARGVCAGPDGAVISCSRDTTVRVWEPSDEVAPDGGFSGYKSKHVLQGHNHFINVVIYIPPAAGADPGAQGQIVTGSADNSIIVWDYSSGAAVNQLSGHENTVSCLSTLEEGRVIISGSWDATVRLWRGRQAPTVLRGHEAAVWAVLGLDSGGVVTAAADKTIRLWNGDTCTAVLNLHTDVVRDLVDVPGLGFASVSNDTTLKVHSYDGVTLYTAEGHGSFVYSCDYVATTGELVSGGEDKTVQVWRDGASVQSILHPSGVWDVAALPNGDLAAACSDGVVRLWTRDHSRAAPPEEVATYEDIVQASNVPDGVKVEDRSVLNQPGSSEGQVVVVTPGIAYMWTGGQWQEQGPVVAPPGAGAGNTIEGVTYDHVFDVDLGPPHGTKKLGMNAGDDPWDVAFKWLRRNEISTDYLTEVAQFLTRNTQAVTLGETGPPQVGGAADPFTGGSSYRPGGQGRGGSQTRGATGDPFTGGARYVPGSGPARPSGQSSTTTTTTRAAAPAAAAPAVTTPSVVVKTTKPVPFDRCNLDLVLKKAKDLGATLPAFGADDEALLDTIRALAAGSGGSTDGAQVDDNVAKFVQLLISWPLASRYPLLDLLRMIALQPQVAQSWAATVAGGGDNIVATIASANADMFAEAVYPTRIFVLRFIANALHVDELAPLALAALPDILEPLVETSLTSPKDAERLAAVTVLMNAAAVLAQDADETLVLQMIMGISSTLGAQTSTDEELFRAIITAGLLVHRVGDVVQEVAQSLGLRNEIQNLEARGGKIATVAAQTVTILDGK